MALTAQSRLAASGAVYAKAVLTHSSEGQKTFYWGDQSILTSPGLYGLMGGMLFPIGGGDIIVYPIVKSWGSLRQFLAQEGEDRENEFTFTLFAAGVSVASEDSDKPRRFYEILREFKNLANSPVTFWQWSDQEQEAIFTGYWRGIDRYSYDSGELTVGIRISSRPSKLDLAISEVIRPDVYPSAPQDSFGRMVARAYGDFTTEIDLAVYNAWVPAGSKSLHPAAFGYGGVFVPGIVSGPAANPVYSQVRFVKNDGVSAAERAFEADSNKPNNDFWIFIPETGSYAAFDSVSGGVGVDNDADSVRGTVENSARALACFRPSEKGTVNASGLDATNYKAMNDDPYDYVETTSSSYVIAYKVPIVSNLGGRILDLRVAVDHYSSVARSIDIGLWDVVASGWLASKKYTTSTANERRQEITAIGNVYTAADLSTRAEFSEGRFVTRDGSGIEKPLEIRIEVVSASKDLVRLYSVALVCLIELPAKAVQNKLVRPPGIVITTATGTEKTLLPRGRVVRQVTIPAESVQGIEYLFAGKQQKDDGAGSVTGTPDALIKKAPDIVRHVLQVLKGEAVNVVAGTLGSFVDARTEAVAKEKQLRLYVGIDETSTNQFLKDFQARWPVRLSDKDGTWDFIEDEMNPPSSRFYRSTSDPIRISARRDLLAQGFQVSALDERGIVNDVLLRYAHAYGTDKPMGTTSYVHPLSNESYYYGSRPSPPVNEPWVPLNDFATENPHPAATFLAKWLGRRAARQRLKVQCRLGQAFYDLRRGHVLEFDDDMESVGLQCPAYRCGLVDYSYVSAADTINYANSAAPKFVASSGTATAYFLTSQQIAGLTFYVTTPAGYTTVSNAWKVATGDGTYATLANVSNADAMKSAGIQEVAWDRPGLHVPKKVEITLGGVSKGPCYVYAMDYQTATAEGLGYAMTRHDPEWRGRIFECIEATRRPNSVGDYPFMEAVFQEVM